MGAAATVAKPTRDRILAAALTAFADRGVEATSLDSLAAEIGIRKQTILYWFPSKEQLLLGVVDHAVAQLGSRLSDAAVRARPRSGSTDVALADRVVAVVDTTFRLGTTNPELLDVVREVTRMGPPASTHLAEALRPLVDAAAAALAGPRSNEPDEQQRVREVLLGVGARVVGIATEAEVRADLGLPADLPWLRAHRRALIVDLTADLGLTPRPVSPAS